MKYCKKIITLKAKLYNIYYYVTTLETLWPR